MERGVGNSSPCANEGVVSLFLTAAWEGAAGRGGSLKETFERKRDVCFCAKLAWDPAMMGGGTIAWLLAMMVPRSRGYARRRH